MRIEAMPSLCDSTNFGLTSEDANRKLRLKLERQKPQTIETLNSGAQLQKTGKEKGYYFVVSPESNLLVYLMRYERFQRTLPKVPSAVQTAVWRAIGTKYAKNVVQHVYFKHLLPMYGAITSDRLQTEQGRYLWLDLIGQALESKKLFVYLVDFNRRDFLWIESPFELRIWEDETDGYWAWKSMKHQGLCFMISQTKIDHALRMTDAIPKKS